MSLNVKNKMSWFKNNNMDDILSLRERKKIIPKLMNVNMISILRNDY